MVEPELPQSSASSAGVTLPATPVISTASPSQSFHARAQRLHASRGDVLTQQQRAFLRLDAMHCAHNAQAAIQTVARGSGASMYLVSNDIQRYQRDIDVLLGHLTLDQDWVEEMSGRLLLGIDSELDPARGLV